MNRWTIGAFTLVFVVIAVGGYFGWRAHSELNTRVDTLAGQASAIASQLDQVDSTIAALQLQTTSLQTDVAAPEAVAPPEPVDVTEIENRLDSVEQAHEETATSLGLTIADLFNTNTTLDNQTQILDDVVTDITSLYTSTGTLATGLTDIANAVDDLQSCFSYLLSDTIDFLPAFC